MTRCGDRMRLVPCTGEGCLGKQPDWTALSHGLTISILKDGAQVHETGNAATRTKNDWLPLSLRVDSLSQVLVNQLKFETRRLIVATLSASVQDSDFCHSCQALFFQGRMMSIRRITGAS